MPSFKCPSTEAREWIGDKPEAGRVGDHLVIGPHNVYRVYAASTSQGVTYSMYVENYPLP